jgi:hypothetical protein
VKKIVGNADRIVRLLLAAAIAILYFANILTGTVGIVLLVLAGVLVLTALVGFCPIYAILGINTCTKRIDG